jgi:hypothetical protein
MSSMFHAHLDECEQCRNGPFNLCSRGATLLQSAVSPEAAPPRATTPEPMTESPYEGTVVRHPNGHLMVEHGERWTPSREQTARWLASVNKAYPYLVEHASHIDGEFGNATLELKDGIAALHDQLDRFRALAARSPLAGSPPTTPEPCGLLVDATSEPCVLQSGHDGDCDHGWKPGWRTDNEESAPTPEPSPESGALLLAALEDAWRTYMDEPTEDHDDERAAARAAVDRRLSTLERDAARMRAIEEAATAVAEKWRDGHTGTAAFHEAACRLSEVLRAALSPSGEPTTERRDND